MAECRSVPLVEAHQPYYPSASVRVSTDALMTIRSCDFHMEMACFFAFWVSSHLSSAEPMAECR